MTAKNKRPAAGGKSSAELAEDYLDFWQRNILAWATDTRLYDEWVRKLTADHGSETGGES